MRHRMTDYSTSSAAPHHFLQNPFALRNLTAEQTEVNQNQRRAPIIEEQLELSGIVVQQKHNKSLLNTFIIGMLATLRSHQKLKKLFFPLKSQSIGRLLSMKEINEVAERSEHL